MNSGSGSLKVTVNGKKYLITGIQRETSCKGLLCAIAKVTSLEEEARSKQYSITKPEPRPNENLLERFKGDRELAGDITSFNIFNSLGKDAKIIAKETVTVRKEVIIDNTTSQVQNSTGASKPNKSSRKQKKETKKKEEKKEKKSKQKSKKNKEPFTTTTTTFTTTKTETKVKQKIKHRSVDDSDIESYRRSNLKRMKQKRRVYDDSDIDIYKNLETIVVDQNKKLRRLQKSSREVKRTAWMKELTRNSQIYYIDDEPAKTPLSDPIAVEAEKCMYEKDDENDSGLPSPEYDSSESQEIQPINVENALLLTNDNTRYQITKDESKQTSLSKENKRNAKQLNNNDISPNQVNAGTLNNENIITEECNSVFSTNRLSKTLEEEKNVCVVDQGEITDDVTTSVPNGGLPENKKDTSQMLALNKMVSAIKEDQIIENSAVDGDNKSTLLLIKKENYKNAMIDKNKNILKDSETCEREVNKMVAFNEALFKGSTTTSGVVGKAKIDKKKFKKSDISDPVLLSPNTLKKHQSVRKVESVLGKQAADVLRKDVLKSINGDPSAETKVEITKEKEKYFNKKLKEIRLKTSGKKSSKTSSGKGTKNEPEYFPKMKVEDDKQQQKDNIINVTQKLPVINDIRLTNEQSGDDSKLNGEVINYEKSSTDNHETNIEPKETSNGAEDSVPSKQIKMFDENCSSVLTADEILNEILEYERNIKNELDQIIQTDENEEEEIEKGENRNNKETMINKGNIDKHNSEPDSDESKQPNNIFTATVNENLKNSTPIDSNTKDVIDSSVVNTEMRGDDEQKRFELIEKYLLEKQALDEISEKLSEYNYALSRLQEDIALYDQEAEEQKTLDELDLEEHNISREIENVRSLLKSVADLTTYQRKEMSENIEIMDQIDLEVRTQKANYENLRSGTWRNNSKLAPRSLIKNVKVKRRNSLLSAVDSSRTDNKSSSSFV